MQLVRGGRGIPAQIVWPQKRGLETIHLTLVLKHLALIFECLVDCNRGPQSWVSGE